MDQQEPKADVVHRIPWHILLICLGVCGSIIFNVVYFTFGAVSPNYDEMRQPIGNLELLPNGWIQSLNFILFGLFTGVFAFGLREELKGSPGALGLPVAHIVTAITLILMGLFIYEPAHTYVSILSFLSIIYSFLLFAHRFSGDTRWPDWTAFTLTCTILMVVFMAIFWYAIDSGIAYAGLFERALEITRLVWFVVLTLKLLDGRRLKL